MHTGEEYPEIGGSVSIIQALDDVGLSINGSYAKPPHEMYSESDQPSEFLEYKELYEVQEKSFWNILSDPILQVDFYQKLLESMEVLDANNDKQYRLARLDRKTLIKLKKPGVKDPNRARGIDYDLFYNDTVKHHFIYEMNSSDCIDLLAWVADLPFLYDDIETFSEEINTWNSNTRKNPYDPKTHASNQTPLILWLAVRSVFLMGVERKPKETTHAYITRLFRKHKLKDGETRKDAVGRAYAIAIKTLQKKGLLKKGKRTATKKGIEQGDFLIESLGHKEIKKRFNEFEKMLNLSQGKRYVKY